MRIGVDIRSLMDPIRTGVGEYTHELLNALFKIDKNNQYFLFYNSFKIRNTKGYENTKYEKMSDCVRLWNQENVHYAGTRYPNKLFNASQVLFKWPKLDKIVCGKRRGERGKRLIDIWFSPNLNFASVSSKTKHLLTIHDLSFEILPECFSAKRRLWHKIINPRKQCERADLILTPSENTARDVAEIYCIDDNKIRVLYPGLCSNFQKLETGNWKLEVKKKYNLPEKFILFLGTIEPRKNIEAIMEAFEKSCLIINHYSLIIAGAKGWKSEPIMAKINTTPGVEYLGYVDEKDKRMLYGLADLFIYPSLYEGFGFPVLEAMASGIPVVTSNRSSLPEVAGDAAHLVNPYNVNEMARAMGQLLEDNKLRELFIKRGRNKAKEFRWDKTAQEFLALLRDSV